MGKLTPLSRYSPEARDVIITIPNIISFLRIVSIPVIAVLIAQHHMAIALIVLAISSFTDALDGFIARACNQVSKIGQVLDPIADRLLIFSSILALVIAQVIPLWILIVVFIRDLLLAILIFWLAQYNYGPLPVHFVGKAGTALVMSSIVIFIFSDMNHMVLFEWAKYAAVAVGIWGLALYWTAGVIYLQQGLRLIYNHNLRNTYKGDQKPKNNNSNSYPSMTCEMHNYMS